jgi:hypothetical protein
MKHECYILLNNPCAERNISAAHKKHSGIISHTNRRFFLLIAFVFILSFTGCTKYLEENPDNRVELTTADDYYATLTGAFPEA